jgi:hypothetical protein
MQSELPEEYMSERLKMILGLEKATPKEAGSMKVKYTITKQELEEMIIENLATEHEINNVDFVCKMDSNSIPYLDRAEINCEK